MPSFVDWFYFFKVSGPLTCYKLQLLFQVALQILKENKEKILDAGDDGEALVVLTEYTNRLTDVEQNFEKDEVFLFSSHCVLISFNVYIK